MNDKIRKFVALSAGEKCMLIEAILFLYVARILLLILPVKTITRISLFRGRKKQRTPSDILKIVRWSLTNSDRLALWKNRCLMQSIAGRWMLQRRGISSRIIFGVRRNKDNDLIAHAWLKAGDFEVVAKSDDFTELQSV